MPTEPVLAVSPDKVRQVTLDAALEAKIAEVLTHYPIRRAALLPALWLCQERYGWISPGVIEAVAARLGEQPAFVEGVVTFYTMYHTAPPAKFVLQACETLSCAVCGGKELIHHLETKLGVRPGERTADGMFQLVGVQCLGACGTAPVVQVNDDYYENLTVAKLDALLDELRRNA